MSEITNNIGPNLDHMSEQELIKWNQMFQQALKKKQEIDPTPHRHTFVLGRGYMRLMLRYIHYQRQKGHSNYNQRTFLEQCIFKMCDGVPLPTLPKEIEEESFKYSEKIKKGLQDNKNVVL